MVNNNRRHRGAFPAAEDLGKPSEGWRHTLYVIIFEADTKVGKLFDTVLIIAILLSLAVIMADSVQSLSNQYGRIFHVLEWGFTVLFTIEYVLRLICVRHRWRYALSFYGIVDLLAIAPTYAALLMPNLAFLIGVRTLRLLRVFRVFKLAAFVDEYMMLGRVLRASARKIMVFLSVVLAIVLVMGTIMYVVEGPDEGFASIPAAVYWSITTLSTVGFGDIAPQTGLGRFIASLMMLLGWGVLAVPTGIVTLELGLAQTAMSKKVTTRTCHECLAEGLDADANFCKKCGAKLPDYQEN